MRRAASAQVLVLALLWGLCAWAIDLSALQPKGYVNDFAGVIDDQAELQIEQLCATIERDTGAQVAVVTLKSLEGEPIEDVANQLFRRWGIGKKETNEGVLLLLAIDDRRSRLEVGYGLEPYIPDGYAGSLLRELRPWLRAGDYTQAVTLAVRMLGDRIAQAKGTRVSPTPLHSVPRRPVRLPLAVLFPIIPVLLAMMIIGASYGARRRRLRYASGGPEDLLAGMLLGSMLSGPLRFPRASGPFGGYDAPGGFGGFGGFGGGDSGGGGASSSW